MDRQLGREEKGKSESSNLFHGEAATTAVETAGVAYQSPSLIASGAEAQGVALLTTIINLILAMLCIKAPSIVSRLGTLKRAVVILSFLSIVSWVPLIIVFLFLGAVDPVWFIALWTASLIPTTLLAPLRDSWLASVVPADNIGRYLGVRLTVSGIIYLGTFYIMSYIMDRFGAQSFQGFSAIFFMAFLATFFSFIIYTFTKAPPASATPKTDEKFGFLDFLKKTSKGNLRTFIIYITLFNFAVNLCGPLYAVYMLRDLKFSYLFYTAIISSEYVARIIGSIIWSRIADKTGNIRILGIASRLIPFVPILWLFSPSIAYLAGVQFISGTLWAAFDLCSQSYIYKATPEKNRLGYIVYHRALSTLSGALGQLLGAYLLSYMFPIFGNKILGLFLLSGVLRLMVVKGFFHKLIDLALPTRTKKKPATAWTATVRAGSSQPGLFYQPEVWAHFIGKPMPAPAASRGMFYKLKDWLKFIGKEDTNKSPAQANPVSAPSGRGLFYQPQLWDNFAVPISPAAAVTASVTANTAPALLHQPQAWAGFADMPVEAAAANTIKAEPAKTALLYQPQQWARFAAAPAASGTPAKETAKPVRQGLLYQPEAQSQFAGQPKVAVGAAVAIARPEPARTALLYKPQEWAAYAATSAAGEVRTGKTINAMAQGLRSSSGERTQPAVRPAIVPARARVAPAAFNHPQTVMAAAARPALSAVKPSRQGLYYKPQSWSQYIENSRFTPAQPPLESLPAPLNVRPSEPVAKPVATRPAAPAAEMEYGQLRPAAALA